MKTEVRRLLKLNSQVLLGMASSKKGDLLYRTPADWLAVGLFLDWTAPDRFHLNAVAAPLYVPSRVLSLSVGDRLGLPNSSIKAWPPRWSPELGEADDHLLRALQSALSEAGPLLDSVASLDGYVRYVDQRVDAKKMNPLFQEEVAYASILMGRPTRRVRRELDAVLRVVEERKNDHWDVKGTVTYRSPDQFQEVAERIRSVLSCLDAGEDAVEQLRIWRQERLGHLGMDTGVPDYPDLPERRSSRRIRLR